jgi:hypothetical protein
MTVIATYPAVIAIASAIAFLLWSAPERAALKELARLVFVTSFLVVVWNVGGHLIKF